MLYFRWSYGIVLWELITLGMFLLPNNALFFHLTSIITLKMVNKFGNEMRKSELINNLVPRDSHLTAPLASGGDKMRDPGNEVD